MISIFGNKVNADYDKLAYDFSFNDIDGTMRLNLDQSLKIKVIIVSKCCKSMWLYKSV